MAAEKEGKTEKPTDRRLQEAEESGDIPRSRDLATTVGLLFTLFFFALFAPNMVHTTISFWKKSFLKIGQVSLTPSSLDKIGKDFFFTFMELVLPILLLLAAVAILMEVVQAKSFRFNKGALHIKWEKVFIFGEFFKGLKKILVSVESLFELLKAVVKVTIIGYAAYLTIKSDIPALLQLPYTPLVNVLTVMGKMFFRLSFNITVILLILALLDYLWQRYRYMKKLKMTKQEVKDEWKRAEGDPLIKSRQRKIMFQWAMRRMMMEVPKADVVITNPTHYAVALKYESKKMTSPQLVAKGKDLVAEKIKEVARENKVPIIENPPVAQAVFAAVEIGDFIPEKLFKPVAEILAYIYKLKGRKVA